MKAIDQHDGVELKELLADLIWLNGLIATELIQVTENTSKALRGEIPEKCRVEHRRLREKVLEILEKYRPEDARPLREHVLKH